MAKKARLQENYGEPTGVGGNKKPSKDIVQLTSLNGTKGIYTPNKGTGGGGTFKSENSGTITRLNQDEYKSSLTKQKIKAEMDANRAKKAKAERLLTSDRAVSRSKDTYKKSKPRTDVTTDPTAQKYKNPKGIDYVKLGKLFNTK
jgi:hypothetical protein